MDIHKSNIVSSKSAGLSSSMYLKELSSQPSDAVLSVGQAVMLMRKLATDDSFRASFEAKPAKALHDMGVPAEQIVNFNTWCHLPVRLVGKEQFQNAVDRMDERVIKLAMGMSPPKLGLSG
jgi:putative modified peptide